MIMKKNFIYHFINHDSSFSLLSYTYTNLTNLFLKEVIQHRNRTAVHTISKISTQMELSKENNLIIEIELPKENRENKTKCSYMLCLFIYLLN